MINIAKTELITRNDLAPSTKSVIGIILLLSCLIIPVKVLAEPVVMAFSNSQGSFSIQANNLNRMIEAEISINYQSEDPTPPKVSGSFSSTAILTTTVNVPGSLVFQLKIDKKKPVSGHVPLAIVRIPGSITSLTARLLNENGMTEFPQVSITNPTQEKLVDMAAAQRAKADQIDKAGKSDKTDTSAADISDTGSPAQPATDSPASRRAKTLMDDAVRPSSAAVSAEKGADRSQDAEDIPHSLSFSRRESLLDRFSASSGKRTTATLAGLLRRNDADFVQEPPLLLTDGTAALRLMVRSLGNGTKGPQFFISGGHCSNLKTAENGAWILEIIPERGALNISVTVLAGSQAIEYPLAVAPPPELFDMTGANADQIEFVRIANEFVRSGASP